MHRQLSLWIVLVVLLLPGRAAAAEDRPYIAVPEQAQPIIPLSEIKPGMRGYGLTIFRGTDIEPFPVSVVSVVPDSSPKRGVIWITSEDPRMLESGGAQGMSGSPIYLWAEGEQPVPGKGGRLAGAFAYVYPETRGVLAGVQPIEYMREVGGRLSLEEPDAPMATGKADLRRAAAVLRDLDASARNAAPMERLQLDAALRISDALARRSGGVLRPGDDLASPQIQPMALPLAVSSAGVADAVAPLLKSTGLAPVAAGPLGLLGSDPPANIDRATVLRPGAVLAVPLAYGDMDLSAHGTVTDVLPDGTVLGFGHAMDAVGPSNAPMATGYVHFVVPRDSISFRVANSLHMVGTLLRDEMSAVAGGPVTRFETAPLEVVINLPDQPQRVYRYQVGEHPTLTPIIVVILSLQSLTAVQDVPLLSTMNLSGELTFAGDRTLRYGSVLPDGRFMDVVMELLPSVHLMMLNPFERLKFTGGRIEIGVQPGLLAGTIVDARLDQAEVEPGETVGVTVEVRPFEEPARTYHGSLKVPLDTPEGDYRVIIGDAQSFLAWEMNARPHLFMPENMGQLQRTLQRALSLDRDAIYIAMTDIREGLAVGQQEMPRLPSSVRAMIAAPTSSATTPFTEMIEATIATDVVPSGSFEFMLRVREAKSTYDTRGR